MPEPQSPTPPPQEVRLRATAVSPGVATGVFVAYRPHEHSVKRRRIREEDVPAEVARLEAALLETRHQLHDMRERLAATLGEKDASVFDAHILVVEDATLLEAVNKQLNERLLNVDFLYYQLTKSYVKKMREVDDEYLAERAQDIVDVSRRVLRNLQGLKNDMALDLDGPTIIHAHDLTPSDTATFDRSKVIGFVTEIGSKTSHSAIMARSLNIPALVGLRDLAMQVDPGTEALIDGYEGLLILNPTPQTKYEYGQVTSRRHAEEEKLARLRDTLAITTDQRRITVSANVELPEDLPLVRDNGAEGIGLYRTEFLYLNRDDIPTEDEQVEMYRQVAEAAKPHSVIIRTLDIGGDKALGHLGIEQELNPFLGWRGIRLCLGRPELFKVQLRALCRASTEGNIRIMFPMITEIGELRAAKKLLAEVQDDLRREGVPIADKIEVGMMIEVPSAALLADVLAREVDFFSVGTNDLIQYTLAVDRANERVADLYQPTHPSIIRLLRMVVQGAHNANIWVGVCGEVGGDIALTPLLVGLGIDELSLGSVNVPRVKKAIQALNYHECRDVVDSMLAQSLTPYENLKWLEEIARKHYGELF
ncbi:phosphoenolpyruvate--protein phosphotransferase [Verrucomicrobia bacterium LW23]|nr:phosphoenolpyruvate--protein phosphotransferase [Verrucomicrobia bacterium LW23]